MKYLLGVDVGTTGTKSLLFSEDGRLLGHAYRGYETKTPGVSRSEQNAEDWWQAVVQTVREACGGEEIGRNVAAISLSLQGGTMVAVDENGQQVRPAMVWSDKRCQQQQEAFLKEIGDDRTMYETTGWHLGRGLNALQIRWMKDNEPEVFAKTAMFLSVPDYIALRMTGIPAVDLSNAGINQLADIRKEAYDPKLLQFTGITQEKLGKIVHSGDVIGCLTQEAADVLGLTTDNVLVAGAHDQYAVAVGAGACKAGDMVIGSGTAWVVTAIGDQPDFSSGLNQSVSAVPGLWGSLWSLGSGGVCLEWLRKQIGSSDEVLPYDLINQEIQTRGAAEEGLYFVPFTAKISKERQLTKGTFLGMSLSHDKFHLARAIMEGVVFQIRWMTELFGIQPSADGIKLAGGATKSLPWCQLLADIFGLPVKIPEVADLACVGAAVIAGVGSGVFPDYETGCSRMAVQERILLPNPEKAELYGKLFEEYKRAAAALQQVYVD